MKVRFIKPRLGYKSGHVADNLRVGLCRTLISYGACEEVKDEPKLDADKGDKPKRSSGKPRRSKKPPKS